MKKILSIILALSLMFTVVCISFVGAETTNASVSVTSATATVGAEVSVDVMLKTETAVVAMDCNIEYDTTAMTLIGVEAYDELFSTDAMFFNEDLTLYPYYIGWDNSLSDGVSGEGKLVKLTFKINSNAYNGTYPVDATDISLVDDNLDDIYYTASMGYITVSGGEDCPYETTMKTTTTKPVFTTYTTTTTTTTTTSTTTTTTAQEVDLSVDLYMLDGASIRLNDQNGIRFYTVVDKDRITELKDAGCKVEMGTLIAPLDYLTATDLNFALGTGRYIDVKYDSESYYEEDDFSGIVGSIISIKESTNGNTLTGNVARKFVGRGYVKVTDSNGNSQISYATYSKDYARSLGYIAYKLKNDISTESVELYLSNKDNVDRWAQYYEISKDPSMNDKF